SRNSTASCAPVEAPEGTAARPIEPSSSITSTSTVGLPRLSRISRPIMSVMAVMMALREVGRVGMALLLQDGPQRATAGLDSRAAAPETQAMKGRRSPPSSLKLGKPTPLPAAPDETTLDAVPNPHADTDYVVRFVMPE